MAQALLVIDMQNGLHDVANFAAVVAKVNQRIALYRQRRKPIIFIQHHEPEMIMGSVAWQLAPELDYQGEPIVHKAHPDSFYQTNLQQVLTAQGLTDLELCGCQTEFCIDTTLRVAFHLGYHLSIMQGAFGTCDTPTLTAAQINAHHAHIWAGRFATVLHD
ncbi:cysteine hydrolase family protein [Loigolactobacillus binensis]|uniref:Cysteine hydrolase family protein n=1 Tax=Loigolactobacillus binensis TaxID=2559922 RepID=A0ABW3EFL3_9LACO|nr:cysteine hydrolase family protein [Loigolactobacillus binensis]